MLAQKQCDGTVRPMAYASRTLQPYEGNYGVTELEALGVVWVVKHFRHYLHSPMFLQTMKLSKHSTSLREVGQVGF